MKIDQFLYSCLNRKLKEYFANKINNIVDWVILERLECMFSPVLFIKSLEKIENKKVSINIKNEDIKLDNLQ